METIKLQGIHTRQKAKKVNELRIGDIIKWNFGYKSEVVDIIPSKTGKTLKLTLKSLEDGSIGERMMRATRLVASDNV